MKKIDIGQTIGILANVGVLAGLLLLVSELNQNRNMMLAQARHEVSQGIVDQFYAVATDPEFAEFLSKALSGQLESEAERLRFNSYAAARLRYWEDVHYQYRLGLYDEAEFLAQKEAWRVVLRGDSMKEFWSRARSRYSPEFVAEIDELISD